MTGLSGPAVGRSEVRDYRHVGTGCRPVRGEGLPPCRDRLSAVQRRGITAMSGSAVGRSEARDYRHVGTGRRPLEAEGRRGFRAGRWLPQLVESRPAEVVSAICHGPPWTRPTGLRRTAHDVGFTAPLRFQSERQFG